MLAKRFPACENGPADNDSNDLDYTEFRSDRKKELTHNEPVLHTLFMYLFVWCCSSVCMRRAGGMGLLVAYGDYGFIFKMKMTEVSNPAQRKQKRLRMS